MCYICMYLWSGGEFCSAEFSWGKTLVSSPGGLVGGRRSPVFSPLYRFAWFFGELVFVLGTGVLQQGRHIGGTTTGTTDRRRHVNTLREHTTRTHYVNTLRGPTRIQYFHHGGIAIPRIGEDINSFIFINRTGHDAPGCIPLGSSVYHIIVTVLSSSWRRNGTPPPARPNPTWPSESLRDGRVTG